MRYIGILLTANPIDDRTNAIDHCTKIHLQKALGTPTLDKRFCLTMSLVKHGLRLYVHVTHRYIYTLGHKGGESVLLVTLSDCLFTKSTGS